jgi:hypothetical protein
MTEWTPGRFFRVGLRGVTIPEAGLRPESFRYLRTGGAAHGGPVSVGLNVATGEAWIIDGRHRILLARERARPAIHARVYGYGPRGAKRWMAEGELPV